MRRRKTFGYKVVSVCFGIFAAWLMMEVTLRLFPQLMPVPLRLRHHVYGNVKIDKDICLPDPDLGYKLRPNVNALLEAYPEEPYPVQTTTLGYKDIGFRSARRNGQPVAALVGDSFTFAEGVSYDKAWATLLAERTGWNVLNFGLNGYGPPQYTHMLTRYALPLKPTLVLWMFCPNDFRNAYDFHAWLEKGSGDFWSPHKASRSRLSRYYSSLRNTLREHSFVCDTLGFALHSLKKRKPRVLKKGNIEFVVQWDYWQPHTSLDSKHTREGWEWTQRDLLQAHDATRGTGAGFVVVLIPFREQVYWNLLQEDIADWRRQNPDAPTDLVKQFCAEKGIRALDLRSALRPIAQRGKQLYFSGDGHWNEEGNRVVARVIADYLKTEGLLPAAGALTKKADSK